MMDEEYPVARLSATASQVLLALLLIGSSRSMSTRLSVETPITQAEFAKTTGGLGKWSIASALAELERAGFVRIIPHDTRLRLVLHLTILSQRPAQEDMTPDSDAVRVESTGATASVAPEETVHRPPDLYSTSPPDVYTNTEGRAGTAEGVLESARLADSTGGKKAQLDALAAAWDVAFPVSEYPFQRLSDDAARKFLANGRRAEEIAGVILDAPSHATGRIQSPRAYVEKALENNARRKLNGNATSPTEETPITATMWKLAELGRKQFYGIPDTGPQG